MIKTVLTWEEAYEAGVEASGGKGWNLSRLQRYGFKIPSGCVISSEVYEEIIGQENFQSLIREISQLTSQTLFEQGDASIDELQKAFLHVQLSKTFRQSLEQFLEHNGLSKGHVSVRSSVNQEDSENASFAGIHETVLNVTGLAAIEAAILKCFASLWSVRAIAYRRKMNIPDADVSAAVVINEMINAECAGVAFSCDPSSGHYDIITIQANYGLGESVVSGLIDPDQYRLNRFNKALVDKNKGSKQRVYVSSNGGGCEWMDSNADDKECLTEALCVELAQLCDRVFHALGQGTQHQDIEWAYDGNEFVLLQARPVTAIKKVKCDEISDQPETWSNGNFRDAIPMVLSHLMAEFCDYHINDILHKNFDGFYEINPALRFARLFEGRFYCHASLLQWLWYDAVDFPPEKLNINLGGHQSVINIDERHKGGLKRKLMRIWRGIKFMQQLNHYKKTSNEIVSSQIDFADSYRKLDYTAMSDQDLIDKLHDIDKRITEYNGEFIKLTSLSGSVFMLIQMLEKYFGDRAYQISNTLMAGQSELTSANHGYQLQDLARILNDDAIAKDVIFTDSFKPCSWEQSIPEESSFKQVFRQFMKEYGHRAVYEIDLSRPRWREDPTYLFNCIKTYLSNAQLDSDQQKCDKQVEVVWQEIRQRVPWYMHGRIKKAIVAAAEGAALKELSKSMYIRLMEPLRLALLAIGKRMYERDVISNQEDIFHCAQCEFEAILLGQWEGKALKLLVNERIALKQNHEQSCAVDIIYDNTPQHISSLSKLEKGSSLNGIGAAFGQARGVARLLKSPEEGKRLKPGDILVAPSTDPAWTPLFLNASAIVMETGGYLSHGSIVAREYGIPAVVNVPGVFTTLKDGDELIVNGDNGTIEVMS